MTIQILKGLHRRVLGISKHDQVIAKNGIVAGGEEKGAMVFPSPDTVSLFDDFVGDSGRDLALNTDRYWRKLEGDTGNDTGMAATQYPATNGVLRLRVTDTNAHSAGAVEVTNGVGINSNLNWKANQGKNGPKDASQGLRFGCRVKASGYNDTGRRLNIFAGFTDSIALEAPVYDTGGALIATADDAIGFWYSAGADTGWSALAVKGGGTPVALALDNTRQALRGGAGSTNNSNTYDTLEFEIQRGSGDTGGRATFWVNGQAKGVIDTPVTFSVAMTPQIYIWGSDTGGGQTLDVDWVNVSAPRDTGI